MKEPAKKQEKKIHPDFGAEHNFVKKEQIKEKTSGPEVFNKKGNHHSFVVDWQLPEKH